jgi:hypothetical protein
MYDCDSPIQDADIEMAQLAAAGRRQARLRRQGVCTHGWIETRGGSETHPVKCKDCGKLFRTEEELHEERSELLN